jgi:hypothetical protein
MRTLALILVLGMAACGPSTGGGNGDNTGGVDGGGSGPDADLGPVSTLSGTVWAPGNAPGQVPDGHEIPIFDAVVYLSLQRPAGIPQMAHCEQCSDTPSSASRTGHDGSFSLGNVVPNTYWLVIQKGQFRIEQQIVVGEDQTLMLPAEQTTLPSVHDPDNGRWVPRVALASGSFDDMEDILGKMGLGEVDSSGRFVPSSAAGAFDVYSNGGAIDGVALGTLAELMGDLTTMMSYHIIFIPCSGSLNTAALDNQNVLRNIRDYVNAGGKLYVTDWSGEWSDNVFPAQVELYDGSFGGTDTPAHAYDPLNDTWDTSLFGDADGSPSYTSDDAEAIDADLHTWLNGQRGPTAAGTEAIFNASNMSFVGNWNHIEGLETVQVGEDDKGLPVFDEPYAFIIGSDGLGAGKKPLTVTFEPTGCGRVLYSTYHTTETTHTGLVPQERVLLYLIMEIGVCKSGPIVD